MKGSAANDIPKVLDFEQNIGISNKYILQIWGATAQSSSNLTIAVSLQPPSFLSTYWWIIGLYFVLLALIPVFINRRRKLKWREYRRLNKDKLEV